MLINKRGVVSIITFSFVLFILLLLFIFVYNISNNYKSDAVEYNSNIVLSNSISSFKSALIHLVSVKNSSLNYIDNYTNIAELNIWFEVDNSNITGFYDYSSGRVNITTNLYGIKFCSNYTINPSLNNNFGFNGSCIRLN